MWHHQQYLKVVLLLSQADDEAYALMLIVPAEMPMRNASSLGLPFPLGSAQGSYRPVGILCRQSCCT